MEILTEIANKIGFDWRLALTHFFNLLIIFFLLVKFILPGIKKTINERTKKIEEGLKMRDDADKIVENAKLESKGIAAEAYKKAEDIVTKSETNAKNIMENANDKASEIVKVANEEREEAKNIGLTQAENILKKNIAEIVTGVSVLAFSGKINTTVNDEFIRQVLQKNK